MREMVIRCIFLVILIVGVFTDIKEYRRNVRRYIETNDNAYQKSAKRWRRCAFGHGLPVFCLIISAIGHGIMMIWLFADSFV